MIKATIYENTLSVENCTVSDGVRFETVQFVFPEKWKNYEKTAVFKAGNGEQYNIILNGKSSLCVGDNECYIPHEVLNSPHFYLSVFGISGDSIATTPEVKVTVLQSGYGDGLEPEEPTPTQYEQLLNLASETMKIAQSVRDDADNGVFKGEKGDIGPQGEKGESGGIVDEDYIPSSNNAQSGKSVAKAIAEVIKQGNMNYANIINEKVIGSIIRLDDISPLDNRAQITVSGKNKIPYPYKMGNISLDGLEYNDVNGILIINGTATASSLYILVGDEPDERQLLKAGTYTLSGNPTECTLYIALYYSQESELFEQVYVTKNSVSTTFTIIEDMYFSIMFSPTVGVQLNNVIIRPQLEIGKNATSYSGYIGDIKNATVYRMTKNLIPVRNGNFYHRGVTYTEGEDGFIRVTGKADSLAGGSTYIFSGSTSNPINISTNVPMFLSGCPRGGGSSTYRLMAAAKKSDGTMRYFSDSGNGVIIDAGLLLSHIYINVASNYEFTNEIIFKPQLEVGNIRTNFEIGNVMDVYTVQSEGGLVNAEEISLDSTFLTYDTSLVIECDYNADSKKYIDKKFKELEEKMA